MDNSSFQPCMWIWNSQSRPNTVRIIVRAAWGAGSCEWGAECLMHMCIIGLNRMKDILTSAEHFFAFVLLFGKMALSLTLTIANELLKQQQRVMILVCAADKVTSFSQGSQHVLRSCFSYFCQTNSVWSVTYLPPSICCLLIIFPKFTNVSICFFPLIGSSLQNKTSALSDFTKGTDPSTDLPIPDRCLVHSDSSSSWVFSLSRCVESPTKPQW